MPGELSGGDKQRLGIVRAIIAKNQRFIDGFEPFSALGCHLSQEW